MSASRLGNLVFNDDIMNHYVYLYILRHNLKLSDQNLGTGNNFVFQYDNDPKHMAFNICLNCVYNCHRFWNSTSIARFKPNRTNLKTTGG